MRKVIGLTMAGAMLLGLSAGMVGCSEETGVKEETKVTTPTGTRTETKTDTVKTKGDNPPMTPGDAAKP
jgi:hypothetical protein